MQQLDCCLAPRKGACENKLLVRRTLVEKMVVETVQDEISNPDHIAYVLRRVEEEIARLRSNLPEALELKQAELDAEQRRLANFIDLVGEGRGSQALAKALVETERRAKRLPRRSTRSKRDTRRSSATNRPPVRRAVRILCRGGDGGNRTRVRGRVDGGVYERSRRSELRPRLASPAGLSSASSLSVPGSEGANPHRASLLIDLDPPPQASDGRDDFSYRLSSRVTEIEIVRVRTYSFPGDLRGRPEPRLATTPTSRPRRSLSSPGDMYAFLIVEGNAPRRSRRTS